jgi:tetratricopeptide (TPR) repeat protein
LSLFSQDEHPARDTAADEALRQAEAFLHQDRFQEAADRLGTDEPANDLPLFTRLTWYWLAGLALNVTGRSKESERILGLGLDLAEDAHSQVPQDQQKPLAQMRERLRCSLGVTYCSQERTEEALIIQRQCKLALEQGIISDPALKLSIHKGLGNAALALGWYAEAIGCYQAAIKDAENLTAWRQLGLAYWGLGVAYRKSKDLISARDAFQEALLVFERRESKQLVASLRSLFGELLTELEDYPEAEHQLELSIALARSLGDDFSLANALGNRAYLHIAMQEHAQATAMLNQAIQIAQGRDDRRTAGQLHLILASAYQEQHNRADADHALREAIRILALTQDRIFLGDAYERYGVFLAAQGAYKQAFEHMRLAYTATLRQAP